MIEFSENFLKEPVLFGTSISENIVFGKGVVSQNEIEEAAKLANAHDFISKFPEGKYPIPIKISDTVT